jgi:hypothetical protein
MRLRPPSGIARGDLRPTSAHATIGLCRPWWFDRSAARLYAFDCHPAPSNGGIIRCHSSLRFSDVRHQNPPSTHHSSRRLFPTKICRVVLGRKPGKRCAAVHRRCTSTGRSLPFPCSYAEHAGSPCLSVSTAALHALSPDPRKKSKRWARRAWKTSGPVLAPAREQE